MTEETEIRSLLASRDGGVLTLTMNRPDVQNALDWRTREALVAALEAASADLAVRAIVMTGGGDRAFCTGADLRVPLPAPAKPEGAPSRAQGDVARGIATGWQRLVAAVLDCEKPVVAAVNGTAAGAGMHLALACDLVVMSEAAKLVPVFVRRGIAPDAGGAYLLTRLVGAMRAKQIYLFGDDITADVAASWGLVTRLAPPAETLNVAVDLAQRLAAGPTRTQSITKRLVNRAIDLDRDAAFSDEAWAQELVMTTEDANEGVRAFIERRDPTFRGW
ncbi:MAG TPA: enoyl-CoA hydratase-related protein [Mycobacteriales bacterium]|jgi:2-(1,2-epoxy-1,2-dihydrophenyl)acetyl-CoA isomerase|nr:enoyl-CoA hydratase-related protein [Mycobacteriales bacterium]